MFMELRHHILFVPQLDSFAVVDFSEVFLFRPTPTYLSFTQFDAVKIKDLLSYLHSSSFMFMIGDGRCRI